MKHLLIQIAAAATSILAAPALPAPALSVAAASPADDPLAPFYGNTLTVAVPDGYFYARRFIDPDGTWREPHGSAFIRGRWERMPDGKTCHWQVDPPMHNAPRYCYAPEKRKVGDRWITIDPNTGSEVIQEIVAGREEPKGAP
jgi:hypothetical protein